MAKIDGMCWRCGGHNQVGRHHAIPKSMEPMVNILIPLCEKCHREWHGHRLGKVKKKSVKKQKVEVVIDGKEEYDEWIAQAFKKARVESE